MSTRGIGSSRDRKIGLSCAECRRSKLRCDRNVPCQTCVRRGCASLCPEGILPAVKGSALLSVQMKDLQEQLKFANARIQELESELQSRTSNPLGLGPSPNDHVLDDRSRKHFQEPPREFEQVSEKLGALGVGDYGQTLFHSGSTVGGEYLQGLLRSQKQGSQTMQHPLNPTEFGLPSNILSLAFMFPFGHPALPLEVSIESFVHFLPPVESAMSLIRSCYDEVSWMYEPVSENDVIRNIFSYLYPKSTSGPLWHQLHPHQLAVFFLILACGYVDGSEPSLVPASSRYLTLACAAMSLAPLIRESSCWTVVALELIILLLYWRDRSSGEQRYFLSGICHRIAFRIGLQRDSTGWNLDYEETQRRLVAFWEMYTYELFVSMVFGRPPPFNMQHIDTPFPAEIGQINASGNMELSFLSWKFRYMATCFSKCVEKNFSTKVPDYSVLMQLDREIREYPVPSSLRWPSDDNNNEEYTWSRDRTQAMRQYFVLCAKESTIFYIHRSYVAQAIKRDPAEPLNNRYGASIVACYKSACALTSALRGLCEVHRELASTIWYFWCGIFSASIILGGLVIESPGCTLSAGALSQLDQAVALFSKASENCRPTSTTNVLYQLQRKAHRSYSQHHNARLDGAFSRHNSNNHSLTTSASSSREDVNSMDSFADSALSYERARRWDPTPGVSIGRSLQSYQHDAMEMFGLPPDSNIDLLMKAISERPSPTQDMSMSSSNPNTSGAHASGLRPIFPTSEERSNGLFEGIDGSESQRVLRFKHNVVPSPYAPSTFSQMENWQIFLGGLGIDQLQDRVPLI